MLYACLSCKCLIEHTKFEEHTHKEIPQYFIPIGNLGWLNSSYICPECEYENAGYDLRTEDEFYGIKTFDIHWKDGNVTTCSGRNIVDALKKVGRLHESNDIKIYKEVRIYEYSKSLSE